jgi:hypothetical protein
MQKSIMLGCGKGSKKATITPETSHIKVTGMKTPVHVSQWFFDMGRAAARQMRKMLRSKGFANLAAMPRCPA